MKTHTVRPTQTKLGFIVDDQFVVKIDKGYWTCVIHLNDGPKKPEDYKDYNIPSHRNGSCYSEIYLKNIMCNEHIYIDINSSGHNEIYLRGFVTNILESDLNIIPENYSFSGDKIYKKGKSTEKMKEYLQSVFGEYCFDTTFPSLRDVIYGVKLFEKKIYLDSYDSTFAIDLSDISLKDEFDNLIRSNTDNIKKILFPNDIPEDLKYSIF